MRKIKRLYFLFASLSMLLLSCTPKENTAQRQNAAIQGTIVGLEGTVLVNGEEAQLKSVVPDGAVIATDENGYCEITFLGSNIIKIFEGSLMKISFTEAMISVDRGAAAAVLRNIKSLLNKENDLFQVESGNVVAGIRGTSFYLNTETPDTTYFCLCNGSLNITDSQGSLEIPLQATHHNAIRIHSQNGGEGSIMSKAIMEHHNDDEMEALAAKIGQTIDWTKQE
jgi:hypothetical protein